MFDYVEENFDYDEAVAAAKSRRRPSRPEFTQPEPIENYCATLAKRHAALTAMAAGRKAKTSWPKRAQNWFSSFLADSLNDFAGSNSAAKTDPSNHERFNRSAERKAGGIGWTVHR